MASCDAARAPPEDRAFDVKLREGQFFRGVMVEPRAGGRLVVESVANYAASQFGVSPGDVVTHMNGRMLSSVPDFIRMKKERPLTIRYGSALSVLSVNQSCSHEPSLAICNVQPGQTRGDPLASGPASRGPASLGPASRFSPAVERR